MSTFLAGFSRVNITPMLGIDVVGYFKVRKADGVLDELTLSALALSIDEEKVILISMDNLGIRRELAAKYRAHIAEVTGVKEDAVYIHCTHTHTGPKLRGLEDDELASEYAQTVYHKMADAAKMALDDLKPAKLGWGIGQAPNISFIRRFRMKDGSIQTNPGVNNPDIVAPIGEVDTRVNVLRFDREGADSIVLVNFGVHPDVVGGCKISADWPGFLCRTVEKSIDGTKCMLFNGAQGDVNHVNVHPTGGFLNDTFNDFDDVSRGYGHARYMGRVIAGAVLQTYDKVKYVEPAALKFAQKTIHVPSNQADPSELAEAHRINDLHLAGKDHELPYKGMMLTTMVARAGRMVRLEHGPESFTMELSAIAIGDIVLIGIPGEPFNGIGRGLKETEGWELILPTCLTNGSEGYFPMKEAYDEGGYESGSSNFRAGVAELIIEEGRKLIRELRK